MDQCQQSVSLVVVDSTLQMSFLRVHSRPGHVSWDSLPKAWDSLRVPAGIKCLTPRPQGGAPSLEPSGNDHCLKVREIPQSPEQKGGNFRHKELF